MMISIRFLRALACVPLWLAASAALAVASPETEAVREPIPDILVQDQSGQTLNFYSDLVQGHRVALNFIFTSCKAICPQLGASSAALSRELAKSGESNYRVISISIDPETDTPERLQTWRSHFGDAPGWTLVTGKPRDIESLQRVLQVYSADKNLHSGAFLLGNARGDVWKRVAGDTPPARLAIALNELDQAPSAAAQYFPDVTLRDQNGEPHRFYSDLIKGRIVVINTFFADCGAVCPITMQRLAAIQKRFPERLGQDVFLYSITVDPVGDTPEKLNDYARRHGAGTGWKFLTGDPSDVASVLKKLGQFVDDRDAHSTLFLIGNDPTGLWKKANGLASAEEIGDVVASVVDDGR
ncbi:hypothetical protein C7S18_19270 [Ahniella affigens]|uniref:Thioredoxin domain-containing protein n=1 Tax=Ahniella affigens TaxID=2021234 RepID=A0A2P1PWD9_9GAMM|nr:SCO family protein [Ahniella affigens]AVP99175.1 hypothetical protein C7S18_19270 [Ahniella affigens]